MALATPTVTPRHDSTVIRPALKSTRPALIDLRFKEDAWVVVRGDLAAVCLGDFALSMVAVSPLDLPALNHLFCRVRTSQARRNCPRRIIRLPH